MVQHYFWSKPASTTITTKKFKNMMGNNGKCNCYSGKEVVTRELNDGEQARCPLCGKVIPIEQSSSGLQFVDSRAPSASETDPLGLLLREAQANRLPNIPETSLNCNDSSMGGGNIHTVAEQEKTPVHGDWPHSSAQMPPEPTMFFFFLMAQIMPGTDVQLISVYFVTPHHFREERFGRWLKRMKPYVVAIGDEYFSPKNVLYFHTANIEDHVVIEFQLMHRKFRIINPPNAGNIPLIRLKSLNENRIPGPVTSVAVETLPPDPGDVCPPQDHLIMTLEYGTSIRKMLISLWCPAQGGQP